MASPRGAGRPLNYFQQSPVRGQLECPAGDSRSGWRYIQCTDTPNELRVLLPPRTAQLYSYLLRAEATELAKGRNASWDRILEIRHLKDRMIRKCTRLARAAAPVPMGKQASRSAFFTVHAPPDFRLKEMERWARMQGPNFAHDANGGLAPSSAPYCCDKCGPIGTTQAAPQASRQPSHTSSPQPPRREPAPQEGSQMHRRAAPTTARYLSARAPQERPTIRRGDSSSQTTTLLNSSPPPERTQRPKPPPAALLKSAGRVPAVLREAERLPSRGKSLERKQSAASDTSARSSSARLHAKSPDPLPIPFRTRDQDADARTVSDSPATLPEELPRSPSPPPLTRSPEPLPSSPNGLPTIHEGSEGQAEEEEAAQRPVPRRRSSLKKSTSMSRLSVASNTKSVAWAMDRDWIEQMSTYMKAANEAEVLGHELEELRTGYLAEVETMKGLVRSVTDTSEKIRQEMEKLQRDEEAVRNHENRLLHTIEQLENKETQFRDKVLSVLEETKRVVNLCDKKREIHDV